MSFNIARDVFVVIALRISANVALFSHIVLSLNLLIRKDLARERRWVRAVYILENEMAVFVVTMFFFSAIVAVLVKKAFNSLDKARRFVEVI